MSSEPYIIYSLPRCGSSALADILNIQDDDKCAHEPFNPNNCDFYNLKRALSDGMPVALDKLFGEYRGFKHVWNTDGWPFPRGSAELTESMLQHPRLKIVMLYRENILQRIVSEEIARQTGIWSAFKDDASKRRKQFKFQPFDVGSLKMRLWAERPAVESARARLRAGKNPWIEVSFESLYDPSVPKLARREQLAKIMAFLGVDLAVIEQPSSAMKTFWDPPSDSRSNAIYRQIPNIEEIRGFGSDDFGFLFGDENAYRCRSQ
jgi:hypothetical protein